MRVLVIRHDHLSWLGAMEERFVDRGFEVVTHLVVPAGRFATPDVTTDFPDPTGFDAIVPMQASALTRGPPNRRLG